MIARRGVGIALILALLFLVFGCGREKPKTNFELGKEYFLVSDYPKAMIRLENWVQEFPDSPQSLEGHAILAIIYHDDETRQSYYQGELTALRKSGAPGMAAVLKLVENPTTETRLGRNVSDIMVGGGNASVRPLMDYLRGRNWRLRRYAQNVLIKLGPVAVDSLLQALDDPDLYVRSMSIQALSQIGDKKAVEPLKQRLQDPSKLIQVEVAAALHRMGQMNPTNVIISALKDESIETRRAAAKAVSEIVENPPLGDMLRVLKDTDAGVRNYAALAIGKTRSPEAIQPLLKALQNDADDQVKASAAKSLEMIGKPAVAPLIGAMEGTKDMGIVIRIAHILGNLGDKRAIKPMEKVYNGATNPVLKNEVAKALNKID